MKDHARMKRLGVLVLLVAPGCGDECRPEETICDGNRFLYCELGNHDAGPRRWREGSACAHDERCIDVLDVNGRQRAVCTGADEPDARCPEGIDVDICLDDATRASCEYGYLTAMVSCSNACVVTQCSQCYPSAICSGPT
jgi:hypothetical protein